MRVAVLVLALAGCAPAGGQGEGGAAQGSGDAQHRWNGGGGGGIVSTNPCADAILVRLVSPARIAAISRYSQDAAATSIPLELARRFRATAGTAEEVIALRPALVLASSFTPAATRDAYTRAGLRMLYLDSPTTVAASVEQVRAVAAAVGEGKRGEMMAADIDRSLALLRRKPGNGHGTNPAALLYIAGDLANGSGTLLDQLIRLAGLRNAAADYGLANTGTLPAELLVAHPPAVVIATREGRGARLRRRLLPTTPQESFDRRLVNCGGPAIPAALARLRAIRVSL